MAMATKLRFYTFEPAPEAPGGKLILDIVEIDMPDTNAPKKAWVKYRRLRNKLIEEYTEQMRTGELAEFTMAVYA